MAFKSHGHNEPFAHKRMENSSSSLLTVHWRLYQLCRWTEGQRACKEGKTMSYPDKNLPEIAIPHFEGERYEAEVPDTLDLGQHPDQGG